jgi:outer membrane protein assembly factor BamB
MRMKAGSFKKAVTVLSLSVSVYGCKSGPQAMAGAAAGGHGMFAQEASPLPNNPVPPATNHLSACRTWKLSMHSHISHVSTTPNGERVLISTSGEGKSPKTKAAKKKAKSENRVAPQQAKIRWVTKQGKVLWTHPLEQPVKSQAVGSNLIAVNTYDGLLKIYDFSGKKLWEKEHLGRPVFLSDKKALVLLNDDDSEPETAFFTYDFTGRALAKISRAVDQKGEPVDMFVANDEAAVIVTSTDNSVVIYGLEGRPLARTNTKTPPVAVAAVVSPELQYYVLTNKALTGYNSKGRQWSVDLQEKYETIRLEGNQIFAYGNSRNGQSLSAFSTKDGQNLWTHSYSNPANYSSLVYSGVLGGKPVVSMAFDNAKEPGVINILGVDASGKSIWDASIEASDGIYSYAVAMDAKKDSATVIVGAGEPSDGVVSAFVVGQKQICR